MPSPPKNLLSFSAGLETRENLVERFPIMFQNSLSKTQVVLFQKALLASCVCWAGARGLGVSNWGRAGGGGATAIRFSAGEAKWTAAGVDKEVASISVTQALTSPYPVPALFPNRWAVAGLSLQKRGYPSSPSG